MVILILYRVGPAGAKNTYYYWRNFMDEREIQSGIPSGSDLIGKFKVPIDKLKKIGEEIDGFNLLKIQEKIPESELVKKIEKIIQD